jgi:CheY-like chemotaxis protein
MRLPSSDNWVAQNFGHLRTDYVYIFLKLSMSFRSLLLCENEETVGLIQRTFRALSIELEHVHSRDAALEKLKGKGLDAAMVDDVDSESAVAILEAAKALPSRRKCLVVVLADPQTSSNVVFAAGAHMVLYKPLTQERVLHGLKALRNLMGRNCHRESPRVQVGIAASLHTESHGTIPATILDLSEGGAAIMMLLPVAVSAPFQIKTVLPDSLDLFSARCQLVWQDSDGHLGVRFVDLASGHRRLLHDWLGHQNEATRR